jgi:hypothetical protein
MRRWGVAAIAAFGLVFSSSVSAADVQAVQDFKHLCMDTHADPIAAYSAADTAGWQAVPAGLGQTFVSMSGNADGRAIHQGMSDFRALTVSIPSAVKKHRACFLVARGDFDETKAALGALFGLPPTKQTDKVWSWEVAATADGYKSFSQLTPGQSAQLSAQYPVVNVSANRLDGGVTLVFTEDTILMAPPPAPLPADAGDITHFKAWIEQDGKSIPLQGQIHLKKRPFTIVFKGSHVLDYSVIGSLGEQALVGKTSEADFAELFNRFGVGAEADHDTSLVVNRSDVPESHVLTNQVWKDSDADHAHRFESYIVSADGRATARRLIDQIFIPRLNRKEPYQPATPISQWTGDRIYLLIVGRPPVAGLPHVDPKYAVIRFD